jgi:hypothetical protein
VLDERERERREGGVRESLTKESVTTHWTTKRKRDHPRDHPRDHQDKACLPTTLWGGVWDYGIGGYGHLVAKGRLTGKGGRHSWDQEAGEGAKRGALLGGPRGRRGGKKGSALGGTKRQARGHGGCQTAGRMEGQLRALSGRLPLEAWYLLALQQVASTCCTCCALQQVLALQQEGPCTRAAGKGGEGGDD